MNGVDDEMIQRWLAGRIGYGRLEAPYWLLGREEHTAVDEIPIRLRGDLLVDLRTGHEPLPGTHRYFGADPKLQPTWHKLVVATLSALGQPGDDAHVRRYQADRLGREDGETLLVPFFPLPATGTQNEWPYEGTPRHAFLASRETYEEEMGWRRIDKLKQLFKQYKPRWLLAYGKGLWKQFRNIAGVRGNWKDIEIDGTPWGEWAIANDGASLVTLAPDPTAKGSSSATDNWRKLGEFVRGHLG